MTLPSPRGSIRSAIDRLCRIAEAIAIVALIAVVVLVTAQIAAREMFAVGLPRADELARYGGLAIIFLTVPMLLARDEQVKVDVFLVMIPPRWRKLISGLNEILMAVFGAMFLVAGWEFLQRAARFSTPALGMPNLVFYLPAAIGMTLMLLVAIDRAVAAWMRRNGGEAGEP